MERTDLLHRIAFLFASDAEILPSEGWDALAKVAYHCCRQCPAIAMTHAKFLKVLGTELLALEAASSSAKGAAVPWVLRMFAVLASASRANARKLIDRFSISSIARRFLTAERPRTTNAKMHSVFGACASHTTTILLTYSIWLQSWRRFAQALGAICASLQACTTYIAQHRNIWMTRVA